MRKKFKKRTEESSDKGYPYDVFPHKITYTQGKNASKLKLR